MVNIPSFRRFTSKFARGIATNSSLSRAMKKSMRPAIKGKKVLDPQEVIRIATRLHELKKVSSRCPDYLNRYHDRVYLDRPKWRAFRDEVLATGDVRFLGVGSFLGNEEAYMQRQLAKRQPGSGGYVKGIEYNAWHLLMGNLMRGDTPDDLDMMIGDACNISDLNCAPPQFIYSHGLLHSLGSRNQDGKRDKRVHLSNVRRHLQGAHYKLASGGKIVGVMFSSKDYHPPDPERGPATMSKDELYNAFQYAGFRPSGIYISESPLGHPRQGRRYELSFVAEDLPFWA